MDESAYDRPFQWGSKRTGPDLARVGGKYPNLWHYKHMNDPREVNAGSIMPSYSWLYQAKIDYSTLIRKLTIMQSLGVPYTDTEVNSAVDDAQRMAKNIGDDLRAQGLSNVKDENQIIALIAYLQVLGKNHKEDK